MGRAKGPFPGISAGAGVLVAVVTR
jgi:hypothetical protein